MAITKTTRDFEYDYLAASYQMEELLQKKTAAYAAQFDIEKLHHRLVDLGNQMLSTENPRDREYDYLAASYQIQELLQQKTQAYSYTFEIEKLHAQLVDLGRRLGWSANGGGASQAEPHVGDKLSRLQRQIEELRTSLV